MTIHKKERAAQQLDTVDEVLDCWLVHDEDCATSLYDADCTCIAASIKTNLSAKLQQHIQAEVLAAYDRGYKHGHNIGYDEGKSGYEPEPNIKAEALTTQLDQGTAVIKGIEDETK